MICLKRMKDMGFSKTITSSSVLCLSKRIDQLFHIIFQKMILLIGYDVHKFNILIVEII